MDLLGLQEYLKLENQDYLVNLGQRVIEDIWAHQVSEVFANVMYYQLTEWFMFGR